MISEQNNDEFPTAQQLERLGYNDPFRVQSEVMALLQSPVGRSLSFKITTAMDETSRNGAPRTVVIEGTISVDISNSMSEQMISVALNLLPNYPHTPPVCFVRPSRDFIRLVGKGEAPVLGKIGMMQSLPYLQDWNPRTDNLLELTVAMSSFFFIQSSGQDSNGRRSYDVDFKDQCRTVVLGEEAIRAPPVVKPPSRDPEGGHFENPSIEHPTTTLLRNHSRRSRKHNTSDERSIPSSPNSNSSDWLSSLIPETPNGVSLSATKTEDSVSNVTSDDSIPLFFSCESEPEGLEVSDRLSTTQRESITAMAPYDETLTTKESVVSAATSKKPYTFFSKRLRHGDTDGPADANREIDEALLTPQTTNEEETSTPLDEKPLSTIARSEQEHRYQGELKVASTLTSTPAQTSTPPIESSDNGQQQDDQDSFEVQLQSIEKCRKIEDFVAFYNSGFYQTALLRLIEAVGKQDDVIEWARSWAISMRSPTDNPAAAELNKHRKLCLHLLFNLCDACRKHETVSEAEIVKIFQLHRILNILQVALPMDRAQALFRMKYVGDRSYGMHWVAQQHVDRSSNWAQFLKPTQMPTMNKRYIYLLELPGLELYKNKKIRDLLQPCFRPCS